MKTLKFYALLGIAVAAIILSGCSKENDLDQPNYGSSSENSSQVLSDQELEGLMMLVEKQKLHRDVYFSISEKMDNSMFNELYLTDEKFLDLLSAKLDDYNQINPIMKNGVGVFINPEIQNLYDEFIKTFEIDMIRTLTLAIHVKQTQTVEMVVIVQVDTASSQGTLNVAIVIIY